MRILVFGDSIAAGVIDYEKGGWVQRLKSFFLKESDGEVSFYNCAISGDTTEEVLARFKTEAKARIGDDEVIIFAIGINDSLYDDGQNEYWVAPKQFEVNLVKLIELAKKFTNKIVFTSLLPVDSRVNPTPWDLQLHYTLENTKKYSNIIRAVCNKDKLQYIDLMSDWLKRDYSKLLEDGLHPNSKGHKLIFEQVKDFLIKNKLMEL